MHERISVNQLCFPGASLAQLAEYWRGLGARRVSFIAPPLLAADASPAQQLVASNGYQVETIAHFFMPGQQLTLNQESWQAARTQLSQLIAIAEKLGARSIYMLTGGRGSLSWEQAAEAFSAAIQPCVARARDAGVALAIENASPLYADLHIAHSLRDTVALAEMAGIGVCVDLFGCWTEAGLRQSIERAMPRCPVIQISDYVYGDRALPSRAVPGDGAIPLQQLLEWVLAAGYAGAFDLELIGPRIDGEGHLAAARRAAEQVGQMLRDLGELP
jgi:sugar phosphate isomerase/epimerase